MTNDIQERQQSGSSPFPATYKTEWQYPAGDRTATIYLNGLLCLFFNGEKECSVGVNHVSTSHTPRLGVWERGSCRPVFQLTPEEPQRIAIEVVDATTSKARSDVRVYYPEDSPPPPPPPPADRHSYVKYCLDLEGDKFHNTILGKNPLVLGPRFYINNGFFCTYKPTVSEFERKRTSDMSVLDLRNVAVAITADIFLESGEAILIRDLSASPPTLLKSLVWTSGVQWDIALTNACTGSTGCTFDPGSPDPEERSDFSLHYKATTVDDKDQFGLFKKPGPSGGPIDLGLCIPAQEGFYQPFSDPAPCAPLGFGRTSTTP